MGMCYFHKYILIAIIPVSLLLENGFTQQQCTLTGNDTVTIENSLKELIENFTFVMHLPTDSELHIDVVSKLKSVLDQLLLIQRNTIEPCYPNLLHQALYGVFRVRGHAIKDDLVSGRSVTIRRHQFHSIAPWKLDLLELILCSKMRRVNAGTGYNDYTPIELSVKLQLVSAAHLLVQHGASVCYSFAPLNCSAAIQYAVIGESIQAIDFVVKTFLKELRMSSHEAVNTSNALISFFSHSWNMRYSAMDIACMHCLSGVSCQALSHLMLYISNCNFICKPTKPLPFTFQPTCKHADGYPRRTSGSVEHSGIVNEMSVRKLFASGYTGLTHLLSGWTVYDGFRVGDDGCDLPRIRADTLHRRQFEELFVNLSIPVVIEGMTENWKLREKWTKKRLLEKWSHLDLLVGPIPYGKVFGEKHGYATVEEFISYMDNYATHPLIDNMDIYTPEYPLYVFDSQVLQHHFMEDYNITFFMDISTWRSATHIYQFILGPVGSGAPFHFHCNAVNALIHGRKKWFLYPPGSAVYSKVHPLKWYQEYGSQMTTDMPIECIQKAGEVIYVPSQWTHATINLDECIGLAVEFDSGKC